MSDIMGDFLTEAVIFVLLNLSSHKSLFPPLDEGKNQHFTLVVGLRACMDHPTLLPMIIYHAGLMSNICDVDGTKGVAFTLIVAGMGPFSLCISNAENTGPQ